MEKKQQAYNKTSYNRSAYIYGNTMPDQNPRPAEYPEQENRQYGKKPSAQVRRNQRNAMRMNKPYVMFLAMAAVIALFLCISYLHLQAEVAQRAKNVNLLKQQIASIKEENITKYNNAIDSIDMNEIHRRAVEDLGMVHVREDQIIRYKDPSGAYVKQYENIPESGVVPKSK